MWIQNTIKRKYERNERRVTSNRTTHTQRWLHRCIACVNHNLKNQQVIRLLRIAHHFSFKKIVNRIAHTNSGARVRRKTTFRWTHTKKFKKRREWSDNNKNFQRWNLFQLKKYFIRTHGCIKKRIVYYYFARLCVHLGHSGHLWASIEFLIISAKTLWCFVRLNSRIFNSK